MSKGRAVSRGILGRVLLLALATVPCLAWISQSHGAEMRSNSFCTVGTAAGVVGPSEPPANKVSLIASKAVVAPGDKVQARLLNLAAQTVLYGSEFSIQRFGSGGWSADPISPDRDWTRRAAKLAPDRAGRCYRLTVPAEQASGRYRFVTRIKIGSVGRTATAEFRVRP